MATNTSNSSGRSTSGQQERETILLTREGYEEKKARLEFLKKRREEIETRNRADQAVYGAERMIKDTGDKLSSSDKSAIESAMEAVKKAIEGTDAAEIQRALDLLTSAQHKAAESLYKQQAPGGGAGAPGGDAGGAAGEGAAPGSAGQGKSGDVIDAEVVDEGKN
jgi:molecular chaperone DnaK